MAAAVAAADPFASFCYESLFERESSPCTHRTANTSQAKHLPLLLQMLVYVRIIPTFSDD